MLISKKKYADTGIWIRDQCSYSFYPAVYSVLETYTMYILSYEKDSIAMCVHVK